MRDLTGKITSRLSKIKSQETLVLYPIREFLNEKSLIKIYHSYISCYLNYTNIAWASIHITKVKKLHFLE